MQSKKKEKVLAVEKDEQRKGWKVRVIKDDQG